MLYVLKSRVVLVEVSWTTCADYEQQLNARQSFCVFFYRKMTDKANARNDAQVFHIILVQAVLVMSEVGNAASD